MLTSITSSKKGMSIFKHSEPIKTRLQNFGCSALRSKVSPIFKCVAMLQYICHFLFWNAPPNDLICIVPIEYRLLPEVMFGFSKKFHLLLVRKIWRDDPTYKKVDIICIPGNETISGTATILSSGKLLFIIMNLGSNCCVNFSCER